MQPTYVYGLPDEAPVIEVDSRVYAQLIWTGWDGSVWDITNWQAGAFVTRNGVEGLGTPTYTQWTDEQSPFVHGQRFTGYVVNPRQVVLPMFLYQDASAEGWMQVDQAWWNTMLPGKYGTLRAITPNGERTLRCRYVSGGEEAMVRDPFIAQWIEYVVELVADDPFWKGTPQSKSWTSFDGRDFFNGPDDKAAPFYIGSASVAETATMSNPGDVEAWPVWEIAGPFTKFEVGVGNRLVSYSGTVPEGKTMKINSNPTNQTAYLDGVDVTDKLLSYQFAPIPPGEDRPINVKITGNGSVTATITPRYLRAW